VEWLGLILSVLGLGLVVGLFLEGGGTPGLFYALLVLGLLGLGLQIRRLVWVLPRRNANLTLERRLSTVLSGLAEPSEAVLQAVRLLQEGLAVERVALFVLDSRGRHAELLAQSHGPPTAGTEYLALDRHPVLARTLQSGGVALWPNVESLHLPPVSVRLLAAGLPAVLLQPLLADTSPVGFVVLAATHPRILRRSAHRAALWRTAQLLTLYIRTAGLQPDVLRAQDQVELLYEVTTHLNTDLSLERVMSNVLSQAVDKVGATRGSLFLLGEGGQVIHRILAREGLAPEISPLVIREVLDRGLAAWILRNRVGTLIEDALEDDRWLVLPDHAGHVRSVVAVPFLRRGRVQGMLFLTHPHVGRFHQEHLDLLSSIANQAAIAIQNARLYEWAENERRTLAAVLDSSANAVIVTDPEGRLILSNPAAHYALGIEDRPAPLRELLFHPDLLAFLQQPTTEATVGDHVPLSDGRTFSVSMAPVRDREGETIGRVAVLHDVSYLVGLDEMKSRFVSTVSHDLKAPLTAIRGFAELVGETGPLTEEQTMFVSRIREVADAMSEMISNLLDLGRIEAGLGIERESVELRDILVSAKYDMAMPAHEKGILIDVSVPADLPKVSADPYHLQQAVANLMSNAVKYTPRGGRVWVSAKREPDRVVVSVRDTGIGIPSADLPHIFEKFYRVQDPQVIDQDGSGLGLAIVKSIIEEHGGSVWVQSTFGRGSAFHFSLPLGGST
jgi:two-component system NtrC family sensor kinase